ncbi:peptidase inhibitor family I36 protein [Actinomadura sp. 3N407]|uniref:peptidase inhibitor family I36 protein n=1 Tax=Actinomadura sp. 3N407 TaxID=3457423 RepID=UPI003FCD7577
MKTTRMLGMAAVTTAAAATAMTISAVPANAGADGKCGKGWVCLYENEDFNQDASDHWRDFKNGYSDLRDFNWKTADGTVSSDGMDNETSSVRNRRGNCITLYQHVGFGGARTKIHSGSSNDDGKLSNNDVGDNRASAIRMTC